MNQFPPFLRSQANAVELSPQAQGMKGYVFEGADGVQIVLWECPDGGTSPMHSHPFDEYAIVVQGTFRGTVGGREVTLGPGQECYIPAGVEHDGVYSRNYRAIDGFAGLRVKREQKR